MHEGRNFYQKAAVELTREWHAQFDTVLPAVGGDDDLAFAVAFYSPDHPVYTRRLVTPSRQLPDPSTFARGWAALCFGEDAPCVAAMEELAARAPRFVKSEFSVQSTLLGQRGASQRFITVMVPPAEGPTITPPDSVGDLSAIRR